MSQLVTVATFTYTQDSSVYAALLESEGIECTTNGSMEFFYSNAAGSIKLQVNDSDADKAIDILKEGGYIKPEDLEPIPFYKSMNKLMLSIPFLNNPKKRKQAVYVFVLIMVIIAICISMFLK